MNVKTNAEIGDEREIRGKRYGMVPDMRVCSCMGCDFYDDVNEKWLFTEYNNKDLECEIRMQTCTDDAICSGIWKEVYVPHNERSPEPQQEMVPRTIHDMDRLIVLANTIKEQKQKGEYLSQAYLREIKDIAKNIDIIK